MRQHRAQGLQDPRERRLSGGRGARWACIAAALLAAWPATASAAGDSRRPPSIDARAWALVDASDGARLAASEPAGALPMASTTKLMTAYLSLRDLPLDRVLVAPPYHAMRGESLMGLRTGEQVTVRQLLYGLLLPSGNDAAATLAVGDAGSIPAFVAEMNQTAQELGLRGTSYANPIGLDDPNEYSSPRDLAALTLRLLHNPTFRRIVATPRKTLSAANPPTVVNRNDLVAKVSWVNGVKTGYTRDAGNVLVASGTRKGATLVSVVMGARTEDERDADTLSLLRYGFSLYRRELALRRGEPLRRIRVRHGERRLPLVPSRSVPATVRRGQHLDVHVRAPRSVRAPVHRGERIGVASVSVGGVPVGRAALIAGRAVPIAEGSSLIGSVDDAIPGPRAVVWILAAAALAIVIGIATMALRARRE